MKKLLFCSYFRHISLCFYSNFEQENSFDVEFNSTSNACPHCILLMDLATPKTRNTWKKCDDDIITFFQVFLVFGVAGSIKSMPSGFSLDPTSSPDRNLSKQTVRYIKNTNKKVVFSFLPPKLINIILVF